MEVLVDQTKPQLYVDSLSGVSAVGPAGSYVVEALVSDFFPNFQYPLDYKDSSGPARVEYRLKRPGSLEFGKWRRFSVGDKSQYPGWPSATVLVPVTLDPVLSGTWRVEMRVVDAAGNVSESTTLVVNH